MDLSPPSSKMGKGRIYFGGPFKNSYIVFIMETNPFSETLLAFKLEIMDCVQNISHIYHSLLHKKQVCNT
jgi:hypothetical protein